MSTLPRWDVTDVHSSIESRSFVVAMETVEAAVSRLEVLFEDLDVRAGTSRAVADADGVAADRVITALNDVNLRLRTLSAYVHATVSTNSYDEAAQGMASELSVLAARVGPLQARLAEWTARLGPEALTTVSVVAGDHEGPLRRLAARAVHQMSEELEGLHAELSTVGTDAWSRLHADLTSQLSAEVTLSTGRQRLPMAAVRNLATSPELATRRAAYDAELATWPSVATGCAAAMNAIKGEASIVNRRRGWPSPLDASLFANNVSRPTFEAMRTAVLASLPDFRRWMRAKAALHGHESGLPWWDLLAPVPFGPGSVSWDDGLAIVRSAFADYSAPLGSLVDRALAERWIDAEPRDGKRGGAFCASLIDDRSLVFLNWSNSLDGTQTAAHELGHAYHNVLLAGRTPLQRMLPMALAETASIFCETLVVERGLRTAEGDVRLALLDVDLIGSCQVVVDIESRFRFETEVFARRQRRTLGSSELNELMLEAQAAAYGDGLDQSTAHRYMWAVKPHYYGAHFYNWPYTYGLLFGLGLYAVYRADPDRFRVGYDDLLSRAGMATAEELGSSFGLDVTTVEFWTASLDVVRARIEDYLALASARIGPSVASP